MASSSSLTAAKQRLSEIQVEIVANNLKMLPLLIEAVELERRIDREVTLTFDELSVASRKEPPEATRVRFCTTYNGSSYFVEGLAVGMNPKGRMLFMRGVKLTLVAQDVVVPLGGSVVVRFEGDDTDKCITMDPWHE